MEKILANLDVLRLIFEYLNLDDQLNLTKVCTSFHVVIVDFMWKNKYEDMKIMKSRTNVELTNEVTRKFILKEFYGIRHYVTEYFPNILNIEHGNEFLQIISNNIEQLWFTTMSSVRAVDRDDYRYMNEYDQYLDDEATFFKSCSSKNFGINFNNTNTFKNINSITYESMAVFEDDLQQIFMNCHNLEKIYLYRCKLIPASVSTVENVKCFQIMDLNGENCPFSEYYYANMLKKFKIQKLTILLRKYGNEVDTLMTNEYEQSFKGNETFIPHPLEELTIGEFRCGRTLNRFINTHLKNFNSLKKLTLGIGPTLSCDENALKEVLYQLKLQELKIIGYINIKMSTLYEILKHPTLIHFELIGILQVIDFLDSKRYCDAKFNKTLVWNVKCEDIKTNLLFLNIPLYHVSDGDLNFWLNFLTNNPKLTLMMNYNPPSMPKYIDGLKAVLYSLNLPNNLTEININGYKIELNELRENFDDSIESIELFRKQKNIWYEDIRYLLLMQSSGTKKNWIKRLNERQNARLNYILSIPSSKWSN